MDKSRIVAAILDVLEQGFEGARALSRQTRAAGNDEESKAEGKYDTRSIEENYLADGLAKQAHSTGRMAAAFRKMEVRSFAEGEAVDIGALVQLEYPGERAWFFMGPGGGGVEVECDGQQVVVVTAESALGRKLMGLKHGAAVEGAGARVLSVE